MLRASPAAHLAIAATLLPALALAQSTERVNLGPGGVEADFSSGHPALSADGRFVAFESFATNLVPGDTNLYTDILVFDRVTATLERVSVSDSGQQANNHCEAPSISADGRFVAFASAASNLVANDTNSGMDVFVHDRLAGTTELVCLSTAGIHGSGFAPSISATGRFVAFTSSSAQLVGGDSNSANDIFVRDRSSGITQRVSVATNGTQGNGPSERSRISADGRFVVFDSAATNLVAGDTNGHLDVFVRDRTLGTTVRVSVSSGGAEGDGNSSYASISADGRFVAFASHASTLVPVDQNLHPDCFVCDRSTGMIELESVNAGGIQADGDSWYAFLSADGRCVAFSSGATNLVPGDTNGTLDVFVRDRATSTLERVSVSSAGVEQDGPSFDLALSADGCFAAFDSYATNLVPGDTNQQGDIFLHERGIARPQAFCLGDGSSAACPCANSGGPGRGCDNSAATEGAWMIATGGASLSNDTLQLMSAGELSSALSILLQGDAVSAPAPFGDGLRCTAGTQRRLYVLISYAGLVSAPPAGGPAISARSALLGDAISPGATRYYQTYYRDPDPAFCQAPQGNRWNISSGLAIVWGQ